MSRTRPLEMILPQCPTPTYNAKSSADVIRSELFSASLKEKYRQNFFGYTSLSKVRSALP